MNTYDVTAVDIAACPDQYAFLCCLESQQILETVSGWIELYGWPATMKLIHLACKCQKAKGGVSGGKVPDFVPPTPIVPPIPQPLPVPPVPLPEPPEIKLSVCPMPTQIGPGST